MNKIQSLWVSLLALFAFHAFAGSAGTITTYAGGLASGFSATSIGIWLPGGVAVDSTGNLYIIDSNSNVIRKVDHITGVETIVAGNGNQGYGGDGGPATSASLWSPSAIAFDSSGKMYIADEGNDRVRVVSTGGTISTFAGSGTAGYAGDGGPAAAAQLYWPTSLVFDATGDLYIADNHNNVVRMVDTSGNIHTVVGNGTQGFSGDGGPAASAELNGPFGLAMDGSGNLYISDPGNFRIRMVNAAGNISTVAGNGSFGYTGDGAAATSAEITSPQGIGVDGAGHFYFADDQNNVIREVDGNGNIHTVAGNGTGAFSGDGGPATSAELFSPNGLAFDANGDMYISDWGNNRIREVGGGNIQTVAGNGSAYFSGDGGPATSAQLYMPNAGAFDRAGNLYIADMGNNRIRKVDTNGSISTVAGNGTGGFAGDGAAAVSAELYAPAGVAVDTTGNLYIADAANNRIRKISTGGTITTFAGNGVAGYGGDGATAASAQLNAPLAAALDGAGNLYIADTGNNVIRQVDTNGNIHTVAGNGTANYTGDGGAATSATLNAPAAITVDSAGNLYIADSGNNVVRKVDTGGTIQTVVGNGSMAYSGDGGLATSATMFSPNGVAVDGSGNLYIGDWGNSVVRMVDNSGVIHTVAGNNRFGFTGDGGPAVSAELNTPQGVMLDSAGNLYIADAGNQRIREVFTTTMSPPAPPAPPAPPPQPTGGTFTVGSGVTGSLQSPGDVTLSDGSTLDVSNQVSLAGSEVNLPVGIAYLAIGSDTPSLTLASTISGAALTLVSVGTGSTSTLAPSLSGGSATFTTASSGTALAVSGTTLSTQFTGGSSGVTAAVSVTNNGNTVVVVTAGSASLIIPPPTAQQANTLTIYTGDQLTFSSTGALLAAVINGNGIGQAVSLGSAPGNFTETPPAVSITGTTPHLTGSTLDAVLTSTAATLTGLSLSDGGVDAEGNLHLSFGKEQLVTKPVAVTLNPTAPPQQFLPDGDLQVNVGGNVVVEVAPSVGDTAGLVSGLGKLLGATPTIAEQANGTLLVTTTDGTYAMRPGWTTAQTGNTAGFSAVGADIAFTDSNGVAQTFYPTFSNFAALASLLQGIDSQATANLRPDGTVAVVLNGHAMTFIANPLVQATPFAHFGDSDWVAGKLVYVNYGDGTCQGFTVQ